MTIDETVCEQCRPILEAMKADLGRLVDEMVLSDRELVRHYAIRDGLIDGAGKDDMPTNPRDLARAIMDILKEGQLPLTPVRGDAA